MLWCLALDLNSGQFHIFYAKATIIASGGYNQIYQYNTSNNNSNTGRGNIIKKPEVKKPDIQVLVPTADELISIKNRLKKMKKIIDSDSD